MDSRQPILYLILATAVGLALCRALIPASEALVGALPVNRAGQLGGALQFFFYDTPKVLLLLIGIVQGGGRVTPGFVLGRDAAGCDAAISPG